MNGESVSGHARGFYGPPSPSCTRWNMLANMRCRSARACVSRAIQWIRAFTADKMNDFRRMNGKVGDIMSHSYMSVPP